MIIAVLFPQWTAYSFTLHPPVGWAEVPQAGRWLEEAGRSGSDGSNDVQDLSTVGHVVVVGSPYHTGLFHMEWVWNGWNP